MPHRSNDGNDRRVNFVVVVVCMGVYMLVF